MLKLNLSLNCSWIDNLSMVYLLKIGCKKYITARYIIYSTILNIDSQIKIVIIKASKNFYGSSLTLVIEDI